MTARVVSVTTRVLLEPAELVPAPFGIDQRYLIEYVEVTRPAGAAGAHLAYFGFIADRAGRRKTSSTSQRHFLTDDSADRVAKRLSDAGVEA